MLRNFVQRTTDHIRRKTFSTRCCAYIPISLSIYPTFGHSVARQASRVNPADAGKEPLLPNSSTLIQLYNRNQEKGSCGPFKGSNSKGPTLQVQPLKNTTLALLPEVSKTPDLILGIHILTPKLPQPRKGNLLPLKVKMAEVQL